LTRKIAPPAPQTIPKQNKEIQTMRIFTLTVYLPDNDGDAISDLDDCFGVLQEHLQEGGLAALSGGEAQDIVGTSAIWGISEMGGRETRKNVPGTLSNQQGAGDEH
jgi:hypothetical protein